MSRFLPPMAPPYACQAPPTLRLSLAGAPVAEECFLESIYMLNRILGEAENLTRCNTVGVILRTLKSLRAGGPFYFFSSADRPGKFSKRAAGTRRAEPREFRTSPTGELFPDCSRAGEFSWRLVFSRFEPKNRNPERRLRIPTIRWPRPCPSLHPAADRREACSSGRCRGPLGASTTRHQPQPGRSSAAKARAARGNHTAAKQARRPSGTANGRGRVERFFP